MRRFFAGLLALCLLGAIGGALYAAEEPDLSIKSEVDKAMITIGDPVIYTVTLRYLPSVKVLSDIPPPPDDLFTIRKIEEFHDQDGDYTVEGRKFTLTAFRLGEFIIDPVVIQYRKGSEEVKTLSSGKIFVTVKSVSGDEQKTDIRGAKPVLTMARKWLKVLIAFLIGAILVGLGTWLWGRMRRPKEEQAEEHRISQAQEALAALSHLFDSDLLKRGKTREYFFKFSEIVRIFFERQYGIQAVESTTFEIMKLLKAFEIPPILRDKIRNVLESSDLAKFAKWKPDPAEVLTLNKEAQDVIRSVAATTESSDGV